MQPIEVGLSLKSLALYGDFLRAGGPNHPAILPAMKGLADRPLTQARKQLIDEPTFQRSGVADLFLAAEIGDVVAVDREVRRATARST